GRRAELQIRRAVEPEADVLQVLLDVRERERHAVADSAGLLKRRAQSCELRLQLDRHLLGGCRPHVPPQRDLEAVAPPAVLAPVEVRLGLADLRLVELPVEVRLHHLLALVARIEVAAAHVVTSSANSPFRIRRARWSLLMTVPIGMSRICA